jgi:hypothetical protein
MAARKLNIAELLALKARLAPVLIANPAVAAVGLGDACLRVYLVRDDEPTRRTVRAAADKIDPGAPLEYLQSEKILPLKATRQMRTKQSK